MCVRAGGMHRYSEMGDGQMRKCSDRWGGRWTDNQYITGTPGTPALFHVREGESPNTLPGDGPGRQTWSLALRLHSPCRAHHRRVWAAQPKEKSKSPATSPPLQRPDPRQGLGLHVESSAPRCHFSIHPPAPFGVSMSPLQSRRWHRTVLPRWPLCSHPCIPCQCQPVTCS